MRLTHTVFILLASTICCIAAKDAVTAQGDNKTISQQSTDTTTAVPPKNFSSPTTVVVPNTPVVPSNATVVPSNVTAAANKIADNNVGNTIVSAATTTAFPVNNTDINTNKSSDTPSTAKPDTTTSHTITPALPTTTKTDKTMTTAEKPTSTVTSSSSRIPLPVTTAVPVSTKEASPSPYKERHFDGLSFLGGIILATSLMAIGVLSWKFCKTFDARNYRTL